MKAEAADEVGAVEAAHTKALRAEEAEEVVVAFAAAQRRSSRRASPSISRNASRPASLRGY